MLWLLFVVWLVSTLLGGYPWTQHEVVCFQFSDFHGAFSFNGPVSVGYTCLLLLLNGVFCELNGHIVTFQLDVVVIREGTTVAANVSFTVTCATICMAVRSAVVLLLRM